MKDTRFVIIVQLAAAILATAVACKKPSEVQISGELKQWHTVTLTFAGPDGRLDKQFSDAWLCGIIREFDTEESYNH